MELFTAVQSNPELQLHAGPVPDLEVSHETENVKRHVCNLCRVTIAIPNRQSRHNQQAITDGLHLKKIMFSEWLFFKYGEILIISPSPPPKKKSNK